MYRHFPWCMPSGFLHCPFSWNLYGSPGNFPIPVKNIRIHMKNVLLCQWAIFQLILWNWLFSWNRQTVFPPSLWWCNGFWCHLWFLHLVPSPLCSMAWEHPECNKHPLTTSLGICHSLSHRIIVLYTLSFHLRNAWNIPNTLTVEFSIVLHPDGCRLQHFAVKELIESLPVDQVDICCCICLEQYRRCS